VDNQQPQSDPGLLATAIRYAQNGWPVFPLHRPKGSGCTCGKADCSKIGKHPRISGWGATTDKATIETWFEMWGPDLNLGLLLDGLMVLDVDPRHGGNESLAELEGVNGRLERRAVQRSGSGGAHFVFPARESVGIARGFRPGLDLLTGKGAYVVIAPSLHPCGGRYEWVHEPSPLSATRESIVLPDAPQWLLDAATTKSAVPTKTAPPRAVDPANRVAVVTILDKALEKVKAGEGRSNTGLFFFAQLRDNGYSKNEAIQFKHEWVTRARAESDDKSPYLIGEATAALDQVYKRAPREPWAKPENKGPGIVQQIEVAIKADNFFARDEGDKLYHFEAGVYRPTGERFIRESVKKYCETTGRQKSWSPELAAKVAQYITVDAPQLWERPPLDTVNVLNGLLDVNTRTLRPHSPVFLSPIQIPVTFDPAARCPEIDKYVADTFPADSHHTAWQLAAWLALPDTSIQKSCLFIGEGANGKSVFLNLLHAFLGPPNVSAISLHRLESDKFSAARLVGKLANICPDLPTVALSGTSMFKSLTGGDTISAERKFESSFEFRPYCRLVFSANSCPRSDDASPGFFRRWLVVPFTKVFDENSKTTVPRAVLDARLTAPSELSGLLNHALEELPQIQSGKFRESDTLRGAWQDFRSTTDPMSVWLDSNTIETSEGFIEKARLREMYKNECRDRGHPVLSDEIFTRRLRGLRPKVQPRQRTINKAVVWCFTGIGLRSDEPAPGGLEF
jgi:putative DNA primase/helicase